MNETVVADDNESTADHLKSDSVEEVEMNSTSVRGPQGCSGRCRHLKSVEVLKKRVDLPDNCKRKCRLC